MASYLQLADDPESPSSNDIGLDDISSNSSLFLETHEQPHVQVEEVEQPHVQAEEVEQHCAIPDLNQTWRPARRKELTSFERRAVYEMLLAKSVNGVLKKHATAEVAVCFAVGIRTIQRIWRRAKESDDQDHSNFRVRNCGRKRIAFDLDRIRTLPLRQRTSLQSLAFSLGVSKTYLHAKLKEGVIRRHTNAIKPLLTVENQSERINYCLSNLDTSTLPHDPTFNRLENIVHIDEKWFYMTRRSQTYYLMHDEVDPVRTMKNSQFIPKIMFLAVVARPRFDLNGMCIFDGKIGVFPLIQSVAAVRSSHNRPRGTVEIKPISNITRDVIRKFMIEKVLPAVAEKWPMDSIRDHIFIQQDNAKTHLHTDDVEFCHAVQQSGLNVSLICQPPNSPDLNVLDLGFFRSIQSLQAKECAKSMVELIQAVEGAYRDFSIQKSNRIFLTLQSCMIEIMKCDGSNTYKIPHMGKKQLEREGTLPSSLHCHPDIYVAALCCFNP